MTLGWGQSEGDIVIASVPRSFCLLCYLLLNHWTKFNQIWCVSYSHEWGMQRHFFFLASPPGSLGRGQKVKYHLISITESISKIFIPNFVCVLTNERYKTYFYSVAWVMPQGWDLGVLGVPRGSNINFFQIWSCGMSNRRGSQAEQNASKLFILGSNW